MKCIKHVVVACASMCLATLAPQAVGDGGGGGNCFVDYTWVTPCIHELEGICAEGVRWCVTDWDDGDAWDFEAAPDCCTPEYCYQVPPYPQDTSPAHNALIEATKMGSCLGGSNHGGACEDSGDCPGGFCSNRCGALKIDLTTEAIAELEIKTASSSASDSLRVVFESKDECVGGSNDGEWCEYDNDCPGGSCESVPKTLTVTSLVIDATNGQAKVTFSDGVTLKTDTTD